MIIVWLSLSEWLLCSFPKHFEPFRSLSFNFNVRRQNVFIAIKNRQIWLNGSTAVHTARLFDWFFDENFALIVKSLAKTATNSFRKKAKQTEPMQKQMVWKKGEFIALLQLHFKWKHNEIVWEFSKTFLFKKEGRTASHSFACAWGWTWLQSTGCGVLVIFSTLQERVRVQQRNSNA